MFSEQFFDLVLNFGDNWEITKVELNVKTEEVDVYVAYRDAIAEDPDTMEKCSIYDHTSIRRWRHLDTMQYKTFINCSVPRIINKEKKVKNIKVPWADSYERHTYLFERIAIDLLRGTKNQTKTAELLKCGFNVINRIVHLSVERGLLNRPKDYVFEHIGIDEKSFKKGHKYVTVLSDPISGIVIDVSEDRDTLSCEKLINETFTGETIRKVKTVSIDMWKPFMNTVSKLLPDSKIVHDRFHLVKYLNEAIDKVRRREVKTHAELKESRYVFLKNQNNLTEKQRIKFEELSKANYEVSKAWRVKENFRDIFGCQNLNEATTLMIHWISSSIRTQIKEIIKVVEMFKNHIIGVTNAMVESFSNAMAERLNGKIQEIKTCGRGYRKFENFRNAILFFNGGLNLYPRN